MHKYGGVMSFKNLTIGILVALFGFSVYVAQPAQAATDTEARASWNGMAQEMLSRLEAEMLLPEPARSSNSHLAFIYSYQTMLSAKYYGWTDARTAQMLNNIYTQVKSDGGYGLNIAWDAFQVGSSPNPANTNSVSTTYTVTTSDHVGRTLLAGYKAGAVPQAKILQTVDSLLSTPIEDTPNGKCMAYSKSSYDQVGSVGCVINVSLGAAAYLKQVVNSGALNGASDATRLANAQQIIAQLQPLGQQTYNQSAGGWPYRMGVNGQNARPTEPVQDWNHNAFTFESARELYGQAYVATGMTNALASPRFVSPFDTVGRIRLQFWAPTTQPLNTWRDASYASNSVSVRTEYAQLGLWAMRLGSNATGSMMDWRKTSSLGSIVLKNSAGTVLSPSSVVKNSTIIVSSVASSSNNTPNVFQNVRLYTTPSGGSRILTAQKTTGHQGNIAFAVTASQSGCYTLNIDAPYTSTGLQLEKKLCITVK
jgi:hypothetical protein